MRIGYNEIFVTELLLNSTKKLIEKLDIEFEFEKVHSDYKQACDNINSGIINAFIHPLHLIPIKRDKKYKVWALLPRRDCKNILLSKKSVLNTSNPLSIETDGNVFVSSEFIPRLLENIRKDINFEELPSDILIKGLIENNFNNAVIGKIFLHESIMKNYKVLELNEREFGHELGQGTFGIVGLESDVQMKIFQGIHDKETASVCNIERKCSLHLEGKINAHSEIDQHGNYHLWVKNSRQGGKFYKGHVSQSTKNEIVERTIENLELLN